VHVQPLTATWSIVAVDPRTREVGSAGASCTPYVAGIVALAPGRGVIVAQARSNAAARARGVNLLSRGGSPAAVVAAISQPAFDETYAEQQYGAASLDFFQRPAAFTGPRIPPWAGHLLAPGVSVQGNTLAGSEVLAATMEAFQGAHERPLAERLLNALEAGSSRGGDVRCGSQTATSAYVAVARAGDSPRSPSLKLVARESRGGQNPVHVLRRRFEVTAPDRGRP
jgi:uncharacterized Ntn-hydrolase superfamily protein